MYSSLSFTSMEYILYWNLRAWQSQNKTTCVRQTRFSRGWGLHSRNSTGYMTCMTRGRKHSTHSWHQCVVFSAGVPLFSLCAVSLFCMCVLSLVCPAFIYSMRRFMTLCVAVLIWGVCCYSYPLVIYGGKASCGWRYPWAFVNPLPIPAKTHTCGRGYGLWWVWVWVTLENPRVTFPKLVPAKDEGKQQCCLLFSIIKLQHLVSVKKKVTQPMHREV